MTDAEKTIVEALSRCRFVPGTSAKRFAGDMSALLISRPDQPLTNRQRGYLLLLAWRFRKQCGGRIARLVREEIVSTPNVLHDMRLPKPIYELVHGHRRCSVKRCPDCGEWMIPRYDQKKRSTTHKHVCSAENRKLQIDLPNVLNRPLPKTMPPTSYPPCDERRR